MELSVINLELTELNSPEKEGYEYRYAIFEQLPDMYDDSSKHYPVVSVDVLSIDATCTPLMKKESDMDTEIQLSLSTQGLMGKTSRFSVLLYEKMPPDRYFVRMDSYIVL